MPRLRKLNFGIHSEFRRYGNEIETHLFYTDGEFQIRLPEYYMDMADKYTFVQKRCRRGEGFQGKLTFVGNNEAELIENVESYLTDWSKAMRKEERFIAISYSNYTGSFGYSSNLVRIDFDFELVTKITVGGSVKWLTTDSNSLSDLIPQNISRRDNYVKDHVIPWTQESEDFLTNLREKFNDLSELLNSKLGKNDALLETIKSNIKLLGS